MTETIHSLPASAVRPGVARSIALFATAQALLIALIAVVLTQFVWVDAASAKAVRASACVSVGVQIVTFAVARLMARDQVMAGWGLGMLMRFAVLAFWAFLGINALALSATPALMSLAAFFFVSTLIEPIFLNI